MMSDDMTLVREFAANQSEPAFAALVERHIGLVHSAAVRQTGDPHLAEEITQAVFIILARKAASLGLKTILSAWLYRTTRYAAADALKAWRRRQAREQEAHMQSTLNQPDADAWAQLAPLLDDALAELGETDRAALVLRYFENKTAREIAEALRMEENAAQRRVTRALEKLRAIFAKRGVTLTPTDIAGTVAANSVKAAPAGLAVTVTAAVKGTAVTTSITAIVNGTMKLMTWMKLQFAAGVGVVVMIAGGVAIVALSQSSHVREVPPSRPASLLEIQQLFDLATAAKPDRCRFEADIEVTTPPYATEQVKTTLAGIENWMRDTNERLKPQQKASLEIDQSNAIVKAHSGKRIQHVREWFSGNYYRLDITDEAMGTERFMRTHPGEYYETWVDIPNSPFSPYASYMINRELHDMMLFKQKQKLFGQFNLWQALKMNQEVASLFVASVSMRDTNILKRPFFDYSGLKMDPTKVQQLHAQTNPSWRLEATDEELDGKAVTHFALKWSYTLPPGIKSDYKADILQGEMWVGQISGKAVCLQELVTNLTQHTSTVARREKYDDDGLPAVLTTTKISADSSFEKQRVVFKRIETNPSFADEEAFAPVFPPDYIVSDASSGTNVILQNPGPQIPVVK
jgi:RNA polymerase sigma factor (sigma-70 family)